MLSIVAQSRRDCTGISLGYSMVIITDDSRNSPCAVFVLPQMDKPGLADWLCVVVPRVVKAVNTNLNCTIALHLIDLQTVWNEFSGHLAADIFLYAISQILFAECHPALIVIKLDVIGEERREFLQVTTVIGVEQCRVERCDDIIKLLLGFNAV